MPADPNRVGGVESAVPGGGLDVDPDASLGGHSGTNPGASQVLGVGIATIDIVNLVADYPPEDAEVRALDQRVARGGNAANTLAVLRQLGRQCAWVGTLADDMGATLVSNDLAQRGINHAHAVVIAGARTPTSYIALSHASGSRTIVHYRDLRELTARDFDAVPLANFAWVHFEGRNPVETAAMVARVRRVRPDVPISVELEKPREGIERLFDGARVLIFSRAFAAAMSVQGSTVEPEEFLRQRIDQSDAELCLLPWGDAGAYGLARGGEPVFAPAHRPAQVVDTLGAGDAFNAAIIDGLLRGLNLPRLLAHANHVAGEKCARVGI
jgi:ketohexokinase